MAEREEGFLSRWSRLKRRESEETPAPQRELVSETAVPARAEMAPETVVEPADDPNADLPPVEELGRDSDYTAFMRTGVAPELRKQALRKLWRSDPVLANLDGLLEYGEDYTIKPGGAVATLYRVGKGMVQAATEESAPDAVAAARESAAQQEPDVATDGGDEADPEPQAAQPAEADDDSAPAKDGGDAGSRTG